MSHFSVLRDAVTAALAEAGIHGAILALDISFNEHKQGEFDPHWLLHFRAHIPTRLRQTLSIVYALTFPPKLRSVARWRLHFGTVIWPDWPTR